MIAIFICALFLGTSCSKTCSNNYTNSNNNVVLALCDVSLEENYESGLEESPAGQQFHLNPSIFSYMYARLISLHGRNAEDERVNSEPEFLNF